MVTGLEEKQAVKEDAEEDLHVRPIGSLFYAAPRVKLRRLQAETLRVGWAIGGSRPATL